MDQPDFMTGTVKLTETVAKGGCAAKLPAGQLREVLTNLNIPVLPEMKVGAATLDDACLWDLGDGRYLIQTLDFFTPIVNDAYDFGAVAATNALSDVYAMGGLPKTALTILAFPTKTLPMTLLEPLMRGAIDKIREAGACLGGGHSIDDDTLKLGFSVSGFVDIDKAWTNAGAKVGDVLVLTKALGTGTIMSAGKNNKAKDEWMSAAIVSMTTLNNAILDLDGITVHAATDVTGFGLAGHSLQMAQASGVSFEIDTKALPALPGALECLEQNILNRAHHTNSQYATPYVAYKAVSDVAKWLTVDPQTSGGLLLSLSAAQAEKALPLLRQRFPLSCVVGKVVTKTDVAVTFS